MGDLISNLSTGMVVDVVNNLDPAWTSALFTALNNATSLGVIGNIANSAQFTAFVDALIGYLDPAILAGVVNNNGAFVGDLISNLSTGMVVDVVNNLDPAWTSALFTALNNATSLGVIGNIANSAQFTAFVDALLDYVNPANIAGIVNGSGPFLTGLLANLNASVLAGVVNTNSALRRGQHPHREPGGRPELRHRHRHGARRQLQPDFRAGPPGQPGPVHPGPGHQRQRSLRERVDTEPQPGGPGQRHQRQRGLRDQPGRGPGSPTCSPRPSTPTAPSSTP